MWRKNEIEKVREHLGERKRELAREGSERVRQS